jgi:MFS family permease
MRTFTFLWAGQLISALGTGLGQFALGVWVYRQTGSATQFAMMAFVAASVALALTPVAGTLADRWDRRRILILSDAGSGAMTLTIAFLLFTDRLQTWHVYPIVAVMVGFSVLQGPALTASVGSLVPREHLARASGMVQMSRAVAQILAPLAGGILIGRIGYQGLLLIDCVTFLFAVTTLLMLSIPSPPRPEDAKRRSLTGDFAVGWRYLRERPGLLSLMSLYAVTNFSMAIVQVLLTPLVLSFATPIELGTVESAAAAGLLLGSLGLSIWGGPKNRVWGIFGLLLFQGCLLFLGGVQPSIPLIALVAFAFMSTLPIISGCSQAILQSKVDSGVQGRVFGMAGFIAASTVPLAAAVSGPLADWVFEPALAPGGALAGSVGRLIGVGTGRGIGLLFILLGLFVVIVVPLAFLNPRLRRVESELPDAVQPHAGAPEGEPRLQGA